LFKWFKFKKGVMLTFISSASVLLRWVIVAQLAGAYFITSALLRQHSNKPTLELLLLWAFTFAIALILIRAIVVAIQFLISAIWGSPKPESMHLNISSAARLFWGELTASLSAFLWRMPFRPNILMAQPLQTNIGFIPVLLIHGYGCNRAMWFEFSQGLAAAGHSCEAMNLEPVFGSIDQYPALIEQATQSLMQQTGAKQIAIVAHSMGGLATRAFMNTCTPEQNQRIAKVVTLGTPHQGTVHATLGQGQNTQQMRINSPWRSALVKRERAEDLAKYCCILSHHDNIVAPQSIQTLPGAKCIELSAIGHVAMPYSQKVTQIVIGELQSRTT
jgi:triacylglycerol esterase/lipase EstA (alpha/beta hydrolase family)